jgi:2-polyprenyl-3-methyl-5-hydroxy-6-metoxy-1,4-benzoquinol methylase
MFIKFGNFRNTEYKGIQELAAYNLHSDVFRKLEPFLKKGFQVLDFGCGQGAFSQRLTDAGMIVDVCDLNIDQVKANVNRKYKLDLNAQDIPSSIPQKYDVIVALEIIEHLQNPWKYISDCISLLKEGGIIVLTMPNISNFISRLRFFMRGSLLAYEKADLAHGHITPLSFIQLENMFEFYKLETLIKSHAGPVPLFHFYGLSRFTILRNTILPLFVPLMSGPKKGRVLVYILRKNL